MWIVWHHTPGKRAPSGVTWFGPFAANWERVRIKGGAVATGAHVPDDHPEVDRIADKVRGLPSTGFLADNKVEALSASSPPPAVRPVEDDNPFRHLQQLHKIALGRGWTLGELEGTAFAGDPGSLGGRSPQNGLTLAEMTLTRPPIDWPELKAAGRPPWESPDWSLPGPGWVHPSWPDRVKADPEPPAPPTPEADAPSEDAPEVVEPVVEPPGPEAEPEAPSDRWAGYPAEHVAAAREIALDLQKRKGGTAPTVNALGFILKKAGLPKANADQLAALLAKNP